jgi:predicted DNA-binding WGR domain protein
MSTTSYPIVLERKQPQRNMARFYLLELDRDLFGIALARRDGNNMMPWAMRCGFLSAF